MTPILVPPVPRLPLWRAIAGFGVLGSLVGVLLLLAPVYVQNYVLTGRVRAVVAAQATATEDVLRSAVLQQATELGLPVLPGDVKVGHPGGKLEVQLRYVVQKSLGPYHVDLHFHPSAKVK